MTEYIYVIMDEHGPRKATTSIKAALEFLYTYKGVDFSLGPKANMEIHRMNPDDDMDHEVFTTKGFIRYALEQDNRNNIVNDICNELMRLSESDLAFHIREKFGE